MAADLSAETTEAGPPLAGAVNWSALTCVVIWSGTAPIAKFALEEFPVLAYTVLRPIIGSALLFLTLWLRREPILMSRADHRRMALTGIFGLGVSQLCYLGSLSRTSVAHTVILASISPLLIAVYRSLVKRTHLPPRSLLGVLGGFAGVVILVLGGGKGDDASLAGDALALVSAVAWMGVTIWPARTFARHGTVRPMAWMFVCSLALTLPISLGALHDAFAHPPSALAWGSLGYSAVFGALIANALWQRAVQTLGPTRTLIYLYVQPVGAMILAAILLGEQTGPIQILGGLLALAGVGLVRRE